MVSLTFPDGNSRDYDDGVTGAAVAESIARSLAKKAVAMVGATFPTRLSAMRKSRLSPATMTARLS